MMVEERRKNNENKEGEGEDLAHYVLTCSPPLPILSLFVSFFLSSFVF